MDKPERTLRQRALEFLARREYSRAELARRLAPHAGSEDELQALLDELSTRKQLSDERYAEAKVNVLARKFGTARILHELKAKGIRGELADRAVAEAQSSELDRAREAWQRKFSGLPTTREEYARHARFLQGRGFSFDTIRTVLKRDSE